jgi:hypothetical protein
MHETAGNRHLLSRVQPFIKINSAEYLGCSATLTCRPCVAAFSFCYCEMDSYLYQI